MIKKKGELDFFPLFPSLPSSDRLYVFSVAEAQLTLDMASWGPTENAAGCRRG